MKKNDEDDIFILSVSLFNYICCYVNSPFATPSKQFLCSKVLLAIYQYPLQVFGGGSKKRKSFERHESKELNASLNNIQYNPDRQEFTYGKQDSESEVCVTSIFS